MPLWGNVDTQAAKPKFPVERLVHAKTATVTVAQTSGNTSNAINIDGASVIISASQGLNVNVSGNNIVSGTYVTSYDTANGIVYLSANTTANVQIGDVISFGNNISFHAGTYETTMNADTILVTATRLANNQVNIGDANPGWVQIRKKVNNDGTVRYLHETLVALANPTASNTASGNTSNTQVYTGV
jgi:hypothetical protein